MVTCNQLFVIVWVIVGLLLLGRLKGNISAVAFWSGFIGFWIGPIIILHVFDFCAPSYY